MGPKKKTTIADIPVALEKPKSKTPLLKTFKASLVTGHLIIVESASKCKSIESYLGADYKCISCLGHIRTMDGGIKSIDIQNNFEPKYVIDPEKKDHVAKMRAIIADYPPANIILASDHDREGEAIAWHICQVFGLPVETTRRILFHEVTKPALLKAVANPGLIDMNMVRAQQARQVLDMLVGFGVSPLLWRHVCRNNENALSAGRCQTPALKLVYDNEQKAKETATKKHRIQAAFFPQNTIFTLDQEFEHDNDVEKFLAASKSWPHIFVAGEQRLAERAPPKPYNTSALLQAANNMMRLGAKETMAACQTLYQLGHITYMRTENRKYAPEFVEKATQYITEKWSPKHVSPDQPVVTDTNNPHEAIRATNIQMRELVLVGDKTSATIGRLYKLIWLNTVQSCMSAATYNVLPLTISAPLDHMYKNNIEIPKFGGFQDAQDSKSSPLDKSAPFDSKSLDKDAPLDKSLDNSLDTSDKVSPADLGAMLLRFHALKGKPVQYNYIQSVPGFSHRHSRYTEASLIQKLDDNGIGRPSTFAMLTDVIQTRKYVEKRDVEGTAVECREYTLRQNTDFEVKTVSKIMGAEHQKLVIDPMGVVVVEFLYQHFSDLFSFDYTKKMEERLDAIASGTEPWHQVCRECHEEIGRLIKTIDTLEKKAYSIDDNYVVVFQKFGAVLKHKTETQEDGKPVFRPIKKDLTLDMDALEAGKYTLEDLVEVSGRELGKYGGRTVTLKTGKYGPYVELEPLKGGAPQDGAQDSAQEVTRISLKEVKKPFDQIVYADVLPVIETDQAPSRTILRKLTPDLSIRNGKFGPYVFYKTEKMAKPRFFDLRNFENGFGVCEKEELIAWIRKTHKINI
uniref:DNA topoisomerase n=1 Tax=viral metagenome TaxID=1070528 RepID=A0A6C0B729_9ZZZZ